MKPSLQSLLSLFRLGNFGVSVPDFAAIAATPSRETSNVGKRYSATVAQHRRNASKARNVRHNRQTNKG